MKEKFKELIFCTKFIFNFTIIFFALFYIGVSLVW